MFILRKSIHCFISVKDKSAQINRVQVEETTTTKQKNTLTMTQTFCHGLHQFLHSLKKTPKQNSRELTPDKYMTVMKIKRNIWVNYVSSSSTMRSSDNYHYSHNIGSSPVYFRSHTNRQQP